MESGDLIALVIGPRGNNHACDLTYVDLTIRESVDSGRSWTLSRDVSGAILSGNPHADSLGNRDVWYFYQEKSAAGNEALLSSIPRGSLLDQWRDEPLKSKRIQLAERLQQLLTRGPSTTKDHPDTVLYHQLTVAQRSPAGQDRLRPDRLRNQWESMPGRPRPTIAMARTACLVNSSANTRWASRPREPV